MRTSSRRCERLTQHRAGRLLAAAVSGLLAATMLGTVPAVAMPAPLNAPAVAPKHLKKPTGKSVRGHARKLDPKQAQAARQTASFAAPRWPAAAHADTSVPARGKPRVKAGNLPVSVGAPSRKAAAPTKASVRILDHQTAIAAGYGAGMLFRITRADGKKSKATASVSIDYSAFRHAYGGGWASRLTLVHVPECVLDAKPDKDCGRAELVASRNTTSASTVTGDVPVGDDARTSDSLFALTATPSGLSGDFTATTLSRSSTWSAGSNSGGFSWTYPISTPPVPGDLAPEISLSYSSSSVDGRSEANNNQPSWLGEGFDYSPGFIERRYKACSDDMGGTANNTTKTSDACWGTDNAFLTMAGHAGELIQDDDTGKWRLKNDDGTRVERKTDTVNDDNDHEYWRITTPDGTEYFFGLNRLPGWATGNDETQSVWTEPVFGNNTGEKCHASAFADSSCAQAWRWNLDYVVDPHGNTMSMWWAPETNKYAANNTDSNVKTYTRGGTLRHIDYGTDNRDDTEFTDDPVAQVVFGTGDRCLSDCGTHDEAHWPDTPWDQNCTGSACANKYSPTFWSTKRLTSITTKLWNATSSSYTNVDQWNFGHTFPNPGDGAQPGLWLDTVTRTGLVGGSTQLPSVRFEWTQLQNRVDPQDGSGTMNWMRIGNIFTESGEQIGVTYTPQQCKTGVVMPSAPDSNTLRCYPVKVPDPADLNKLKTDWYHKYAVAQVSDYDQLTGNNATITRYEYGTPAWHHDDANRLTTASKRTWSQFRGYDTVTTKVGESGSSTLTTATYYQGMDGDTKADGTTRSVTIPAGIGTAQPDADALSGMLRERTVYNGTTDKPVSRTVNEGWQSAPTATRTIAGDSAYARHTGTKTIYDQTALDAGRGWRTTKKATDFDSYGMPRKVDDAGDINKTGDEQCTTTTYIRNTATNILSTVGRTVTTALTCATSPTDADDVISDKRTGYDGQPYGTAPTKGDATLTEQAKDWTTSGPIYLTAGHSTVDAYGRTIDIWGARDAKTHTDFTPAEGGPVTKVTTTNPLGWSTSAELGPRGNTIGAVDANSNRTDNEYDALGRLVKVWKAPRVKGKDDPNATFAYTISSNGNNSVTSSVLNAATTLTTGKYTTTYTIYDGLLRQRQTQTAAVGGDGGRVIADTIYDSAGRKHVENAAHFDPLAPSSTLYVDVNWVIPQQTRTDYDRAGRVTASVQISKEVELWRTTTTYGGDYTATTPPHGGTPTRTTTDARGNTTELRQYHGETPTGDYDATSYTYNRKQQQTTVTDPSGNTWTYEYDLLGHQTSVTDPDSGTMTATYNDAGDLTTTTDARGQTLAYSYDTLGRKTGLYDGSVADTNKRATWTFDTAVSGKGFIADSHRWVDGHDYKTAVRNYNTLGKPVTVDYVIPSNETGLAGSYRYVYGYAADGTLKSLRYPAVAADTPDAWNETVTTSFDDTTGLPTELASSDDTIPHYVTQTSYTNFGELETVTYHGTALAFVSQSRSYDDATRRLAETKTTIDASPATVSDTRYTYDSSGNITGTHDTATGDIQCYTYDYVQRLTQAWTPNSTSTCASTASTDRLGGPAPYWQQYRYDTSGNRTQLINHASLTTGGTVETTTYTYPEPGALQPHTLLAATTTDSAGDTTSNNYTYDPAGNTIRRPGANAAQSLTWDPEGKLSNATDGQDASSYIDDADGNRLVTHDKEGSTLYLPNQEVHYDPANQKTACTRYYSYQGQSFAVRHDGGTYTWLVNDAHGTAQATIQDSLTHDVAWRRQDPFGNPRGIAPGTWPTTRGYLNGQQDQTSLTHLGAREYDPATGRFVSDDSVTDVNNPQQMNGFAYANNSPITYQDPDGKRLGCSDVTPCGPIDRDHPTGKYAADGRYTGPNPSIRYYNGYELFIPGRGDSPARGPRVDCGAIMCDGVLYAAQTKLGRDLWKHPGDLCGALQGHGGCGDIKNTLKASLFYILDDVVRAASEAGIDPRLLLMVLIRESGDHQTLSFLGKIPGSDKIKHVSLGIANMQKQAFEQAKEYSNGAIDYDWVDTANDPVKSIRAAAFLLAKLGDELKPGRNRGFSNAQYIRIGYRGGAAVMEETERTGVYEDGTGLLDRAFRTSDYIICKAGFYTCDGA
ncbi:RHS repeat-associated core domain-containing protein [Actinocatenispora sera]|uniref:RHS repeat domain-containing protein n=1 Tax=Actinocatenispora sera TaxID=390989 RepID=UPI0033C791F6